MWAFVSGVEFFGGMLLLVGLFTRLAATPLVIVMIVATMHEVYGLKPVAIAVYLVA